MGSSRFDCVMFDIQASAEWLQNPLKSVTIVNGNTVETIATSQGECAIKSLLVAALDSQAIDSTVEAAIYELV